MKKDVSQLEKDFLKAINTVGSIGDLQKLEQAYFSRKSGKMTLLMKGMGGLSEKERKEVGAASNKVKKTLEQAIAKKQRELEAKKWEQIAVDEAIDVTQPYLPTKERGTLHPLTQALWELERVVKSMGFLVEDGPELESDYYNFQALNIPEFHPARDAQDTFYIKDHPNWLMRAHPSNMQVRLLQKYGAPLRAAYPGRNFRNEALDATHEHTFMQFEALVVDREINVSHLVGIIQELLEGLLKREVELRLRPSFFPFVEPGFELDIKYTDKNGKEKWMEMLGCGLMHPNVIRAANLDPNEWQGLAFAWGLDRMVMIKHGIEDVRHFRSGDLRFLKQF